MPNIITILFPYRNRDVTRVNLALQSLQVQTQKNFEVLFIDYGSEATYATAIENVVKAYDFAKYIYVGHPGLLWNKSKALNYGIKSTTRSHIVTADVDLIFTPNFIDIISRFANENQCSLFKIGYLSEAVSKLQKQQLQLDGIQTTHIGNTFGIGLYSKSVLETVGGLDEFFHFYGSEDEDLNCRVQLTGTTLNVCDTLMLYHQWHPRYPQRKDNQLTINPRLTNILRINQRRFLEQKRKKVMHPNRKTWGLCFTKSDAEQLEHPDEIIKLPNIAAHVDYCFGEELQKKQTGIVKIEISEEVYYKSLKYKLKQLLGKQTQPYLSLKEVNDIVLKNLLFSYRDKNYKYSVSENLKQINITIDFAS